MGMVMGVTAVIVAIAAGIVGLLVWTALLFPQPTARARAALAARPIRCALSGLGLTLLLGLPALRLLQAPHGGAKLAGWALALPLAAILIVGFAAMAQLLGDRMQGLSPALTPLSALVRGAVTIELAAILPFVGWFLFAPLVGLTLVGAGAHGCFAKRLRRGIPQRHEAHQEHEAIRGEASGETEETAPVPVASLIAVLSLVLRVLCVLCALRGSPVSIL